MLRAVVASLYDDEVRPTMGIVRRRYAEDVLRRRYIRHRPLILESFLEFVKRGFHRKNRPPVLDGDYPAGRKTLAVTAAIDFVDDGVVGIRFPQKIAMDGMDPAVVVDRGLSRLDRLAQDLTAINALHMGVGNGAPK